jgi:hypothetical protein
MLFMSPHSLAGDGMDRYNAISTLLQQGEISDTRYSMVGPLFSTVLFALGKIYKSPDWWCAKYNFFVFSIGLLFMYRLLREVDSRLARTFLLILIFGSMFPHHQMKFYGEVFTAVLVATGILAINCGHPALGWIAIILGVVNIPPSILGLGLMVVVVMLTKRQVRYITIPTVALGVIITESWLRRGAPFINGYEGDAGFATILPYSGLPGFSYPLLFGLISIIFSFGKGIIWFCPGLFLPVKKGMPNVREQIYRSYTLCIAFVIGLILVYSKWWAWYGGWFWGPRFFLFASIPASFAIAIHLQIRSKSIIANLSILVVLCWSFWVGANGLVFGQNNLEICRQNDYALEFLCWYVPSFSVLFRPFVGLAKLGIADISFIVMNVIVCGYLAIPLIACLVRSIILRAREIANGCELSSVAG